MPIIVAQGVVHTTGPGCFFTVFEYVVPQGQKERFAVEMRSPYSGEIVVEPTGNEGSKLITAEEVFTFLNDHRDW